MKQDFEIGQDYLMKIMGDYFQAPENDTMLIRFDVSNFKYRNSYSTSWHEPTDAQKLAYVYVGVVLTTTRQINFYFYDSSDVRYSWRTFSRDAFLEIWGITTLNLEQANNYLKPYTIANPYEFYLYKMTGDCEIVDKATAGNLGSPVLFYGVLKESIELLNPSIVIEYDDELLKYNYAYIPKLKRYYYITNVNCVRNKIFTFFLHVDVLQTYVTDINAQQGYIERSQEKSTFLSLMADERLPLLSVKEISYPTLVDTYMSPNLKNVTFTSRPQNYYIIMNALSTALFWIYSNDDIPTPDSDVIPVVVNKHISGDNVYLFNKPTLSSVTQANVKDSGTASFIKSIVMFPIDDMRTLLGYSATATPTNSIGVGTKLLESGNNYGNGTPAPNMAFNNLYGGIPALIIKDFSITPLFSDAELYFLNYEPYSTYQMFIPFIGLVDLNSRDILEKRIVVYYAVDESSGQATCYIKVRDTATSSWKTIYCATCQVGVQIPIDSSNHLELEKTKQNIYLNMLMGTLTSIATTAGGAVSGKTDEVTKGMTGLGSSAVNAITSLNSLIDRASVHPSSPDTALYDIISNVWVRVSHANPAQLNMPSNTIYPRVNGYPSKVFANLSSYTGKGYVEVTKMHYAPVSQTYITKTEIDEIVALARDGIIL